MTTQTVVDEEARLSALRSLQLLETPLEERFERITRMACRLLDVPIAAISLIDAERQWFKSIQGLDVVETPREVAFCAHAIRGDAAFVVTDTHQDQRFRDNPLVIGAPQIRSYAGVPLAAPNNQRIGTICAIDSKPRRFDHEQLALLNDLAEMVKVELAAAELKATHLQLIRELEQAERAALIDPLTRLWNRGGGERLLALEWAAAVRHARPLGLALVDIDHFKTINDTLGHAGGDHALRHFAATLLQSLRASDVVARWGGDEFLMILPDCGRAQLEDALQRVIAQLGADPLEHAGAIHPLTASIGGWTGIPTAEASEPRVALAHADQALYAAKRLGRDQFSIR